MRCLSEVYHAYITLVAQATRWPRTMSANDERSQWLVRTYYTNMKSSSDQFQKELPFQSFYCTIEQRP